MNVVLHRAGAGDHHEVAAADLCAAHVDDGIGVVEFAVCIFIRFLNAAHGFHHVQRGDQIDVQLGGVADQADDRVLRAFGDVQIEAAVPEKFGQIIDLFGICVFFQKNDHG